MADQHAITIHWNNVVLESIKLTKTSPPLAARALAMVHTAIYDAWSIYHRNALSTTTGKYIKRYEQYEEGDIEQALSFAAFRVCNNLFWTALPINHKQLFTKLMHHLNYDPNNSSINTHSPAGIGNLIGNLIIDYRNGDGANQSGMPYSVDAWSDYSGYLPPNPPVPAPIKNINLWQPLTGADKVSQTFIAAQWPMVRPFALESSKQFRPPPPFTDFNEPKEFRKQAEEIFEFSQ